MLGQVYCVGISRRRFAGAFSREKRERPLTYADSKAAAILKHAPPTSGTQNEEDICSLDIRLFAD